MNFYILSMIIILIREVNSQLTPIIQLTDGSQLRGVVSKAGNDRIVSKFLGIPYAQPPSGSQRFKLPKKNRSWRRVLNATTYSKTCWQKESTFTGIKKATMSEDCLYLNVWVPGHVTKNATNRLSVMVWIHGGGFYGGSASEKPYEASILCTEERIIVVSMNYRLNIFGFLYSGDQQAPGNAGMMDQLLALEWVHKNIDRFGGDPESVTIFGESAGGASVGFHALSPLSAPYFKRFIVESGAPINPWAVNSASKLITAMNDIADKVGCGKSKNKSVVQCLRTVEPKTLVKSFNDTGPDFLMLTWAPVLDGRFVPENPLDALKGGRFKNKDMLIGGTTNEATMFFLTFFKDLYVDPTTKNISYQFLTSDKIFRQVIQRILPSAYKNDSLLEDVVHFEYSDWLGRGANENALSRQLSLDRMASDFYFLEDLTEMSKQYQKRGNRVYQYLFQHGNSQWPVPQWLGCMHAMELAFVFGLPLNTHEYRYNEEEKAFSRKITRYWANFARTGNPNMNPDGTRTDEIWPEFGVNENYVHFLENRTDRTKSLRKRELRFWYKIIPEIASNCKKT